MNYKALLFGALLALPCNAETVYKNLGRETLIGYSSNEQRSVLDLMTLDNGVRVACVEFVDCGNDGKVDYAYYSHGGPNSNFRRSKMSEKEKSDLDEQFKELKEMIKWKIIYKQQF